MTLLTLGIVLIVIGAIATIFSVGDFLIAPAIVAASYGFEVLFSLILLGGGILLTVLGRNQLRG